MRLLILGGTVFLGRHAAEAATSRGHQVTLFHRGRSNPGVLQEAEHVIGDRDGGLGALAGGRWDAVIDTSGYVPRVVGDAARELASRVAHYVFVSSVSAYADITRAGADESHPLATLEDPATEAVTGATYGALKAACERAAEDAMPGRVLHVRAGLLVGPHDTTDRFPYWPRRIARGGEVLAPGTPAHPVQLVDARDLAEWMVSMAEQRVSGAFNATGPAEPLTLGALLERARSALGSSARLTWVDERFLLEHSVTPWTEMPLWVPESESDFERLDLRRAIGAGLRFRALEDTLRDTLAWDRATPPEARPKRAGPAMGGPLGPLREAELLAAWHATRG